MEMVKIPKEKLERMKLRIKQLEKLEKIDFELIEKFRRGLEDLKHGRVKKVV